MKTQILLSQIASKTRFFFAAGTTFFAALGNAFAEENLENAAENSAENAAEKSPREPSLSLGFVYGNGVKHFTRGGIDLAGFDLRANHGLSAEDEISLSLLYLFGSDNISVYEDLDVAEVALLFGYKRFFPVIEDKYSFFLGAQIGFAYTSFTIDEGAYSGWEIYRTDSDLSLAYALEAGLEIRFSKQWSVIGGYAFYGNTANVGGVSEKFHAQQYHTFRVGISYSF